MKPDTVQLGTWTRKELKEAVASGRIRAVIVPLGSFEQHQDHLPLLHDTLSVAHIAEQVALNFRPSVVVTPAVWASADLRAGKPFWGPSATSWGARVSRAAGR